MAKRSSKHAGREVQLSWTFGGGLNLADPPTAIADGELSDCRNFWYPNGGNVIQVRPGIEYIASNAAGLTNLYSYQKGNTASFLVAGFDDGKVRYLSGASWVEFGTLSSSNVTPAFATYHDKLIVGDIATNLSTWAGTGSMSTLAGSPKAQAVCEIGGRLACSSADDLDAVVFSAPEDETEWDVASNAAFIRVGYGDGQEVRGLTPFGGDLVVFKASAGGGKVMRIVNAALDPTNWSVAQVAANQPLTGPQSTAFIGNDIVFATPEGVQNVLGVQQYGDLQIGAVGRKVNSAFNGKAITNISYLPTVGMAFLFANSEYKVYVLHAFTGAWTALDFQQIRMTCACVHDGEIYLGSTSGKLYKLTSQESRDEVSSNTFRAIVGRLRGKQVVFQGEAVPKWGRVYYELESGSQIQFNAIGPDNVTATTLLSIDGQTDAGLVYDATGYLNDATPLLAASSVWYRTGRARMREQSITPEIKSTEGRYKIRQVDLRMARVAG